MVRGDAERRNLARALTLPHAEGPPRAAGPDAFTPHPYHRLIRQWRDAPSKRRLDSGTQTRPVPIFVPQISSGVSPQGEGAEGPLSAARRPRGEGLDAPSRAPPQARSRAPSCPRIRAVTIWPTG
ncbi:MAG: hypothetical protein Kow0013_14100 [Pararhodobacter sp.]